MRLLQKNVTELEVRSRYIIIAEVISIIYVSNFNLKVLSPTTLLRFFHFPIFIWSNLKSDAVIDLQHVYIMVNKVIILR